MEQWWEWVELIKPDRCVELDLGDGSCLLIADGDFDMYGYQRLDSALQRVLSRFARVIVDLRCVRFFDHMGEHAVCRAIVCAERTGRQLLFTDVSECPESHPVRKWLATSRWAGRATFVSTTNTVVKGG